MRRDRKSNNSKIESLKTEVKDEKGRKSFGITVYKGEDITFTAIGIGMDNVNPQAGYEICTCKMEH